MYVFWEWIYYVLSGEMSFEVFSPICSHVNENNKTRGPWALTFCLRTTLAICESSRSCTYTPFLPQGWKLSLFSLYEQQFSRYVPIFKIAIFGHETWPFQKLHIYLLFTPRGRNWAYFCSTGRFSRYGPIFKIFGDETWPLAKVQEVAHKPSFYPKGSKLSLF